MDSSVLIRSSIEDEMIDVINGIASDLAFQLNNNCGLLSGNPGPALFYAYKYKCFQKAEDLDLAIKIIEDCFDDVNEKLINRDFSLANGISGFLWSLHHLIKIGIIPDDNDCSRQLDSYIEQSIETDADEGLYDLLYKMLGKAIYFLEKKPDEKSVAIVRKVVDHLGKIKIEDNDGVYWLDKLGSKIDTTQSLGMAHGIPSIISFLSKVYSRGLEKEKTADMVSKAISWLLKKELKGGNSLFPNSGNDNRASRLSWCYGDLSISLALFHAGKNFNNIFWMDEAKRIALNSAERDFESANIHIHETGYFDPCFCHGTIGISHIFKRIYEITNDIRFKNINQYWLNKTIELKKFNMEGIGGYVRFSSHLDDNGKFLLQKDQGLLNGASAIGLGLLTNISEEPLYWDRFFLTDISG